MTPEALGTIVNDFLSEAAGAVVLEDGALAFDLAQAKYSISGEFNKCLLHLWSAERNTVRRVLDAEVKSGTLRLWQCSGWGRRVRRSWRFAGNATAERHRRNGSRAPRINTNWRGRWSGSFPGLRLCG
jgi:hypothetical protein